jgi:carbonic anhydrase
MPENDAFIVRDFGNQMSTAAGSVEYGVHDLHTPLLLVLGHTGCAAVKAAMGNFDHEPAAVKAELETLVVPKAKEKEKDDGDESAEKPEKHERSKLLKNADDVKGDAKKDEPPKPSKEDIALAQAVVFNVHAQVSSAVAKFAEDIEAGNLTVVGAVLDVRNDMGRGAGKLIVVDVNGHSDASTVNAFERALSGGAPHAMVVPGSDVAATPPAATVRPAKTIEHREEIRAALRQLTQIDPNSPVPSGPGASARPSAVAPATHPH